jgi:hypothetical protein
MSQFSFRWDELPSNVKTAWPLAQEPAEELFTIEQEALQVDASPTGGFGLREIRSKACRVVA